MSKVKETYKKLLDKGDKRSIVVEFEQEFAEDIVALVASYSARLYGRRGGRRKREENTVA